VDGVKLMAERLRNNDAPPPQRVDDESATPMDENRQTNEEHKRFLWARSRSFSAT
jgi:hypothetical protein